MAKFPLVAKRKMQEMKSRKSWIKSITNIALQVHCTWKSLRVIRIIDRRISMIVVEGKDDNWVKKELKNCMTCLIREDAVKIAVIDSTIRYQGCY